MTSAGLHTVNSGSTGLAAAHDPRHKVGAVPLLHGVGDAGAGPDGDRQLMVPAVGGGIRELGGPQQ